MKALLKKLLKPLYRLIISRLAQDLGSIWIQDMKQSNKNLEEQMNNLRNLMYQNHSIVTGLRNHDHPLREHPEALSHDHTMLAEALTSTQQDLPDILPFVGALEKLNLKGTTVAIIGAKNTAIRKAVLKQKPKRIITIHTIPQSAQKKSIKDVHYIYPLQISSLSLPQIDIVIFGSVELSTVALNHDLFGLGPKIKKAVVMNLMAHAETAFTEDMKIQFFPSHESSFNDNYIRQRIHVAGFSEVACLYTYGRIVQTFDKKISRFTYISSDTSSYRVTRKNTKFASNPEYNSDKAVQKVYIGRKLPKEIARS